MRSLLLAGNVCLTLISFQPGMGRAEVMAHYNPLLLWMWIGGALLLLGVVFSLWPDPNPYPVFAAAQHGKKGRRTMGDGLVLNKRLGFRHSDRIIEAIVVSVLVVFAVLTASIALYWIFGSFKPLAEQSVMTVEEWQRLEDETTRALLKQIEFSRSSRSWNSERALDKSGTSRL